MQTEQRIGIFGGSFNPVHLGHLVLAQDACERYELERVLFMPCAQAPHKTSLGLAEARHRLAMLELVAEHDDRFTVSSLEIQRGGVSYTIDTVQELQRRHPEARLFFLIGADSLRDLHTWKNIDQLLECCEFLSFRRPGVSRQFAPEELGLPGEWAQHLLNHFIEGHEVGISSSEIRRRVAEGMSIRYLVPPAVEMYISEHHLYRA
jgi:nicotinate-nucleotide adenylyltransferase